MLIWYRITFWLFVPACTLIVCMDQAGLIELQTKSIFWSLVYACTIFGWFMPYIGSFDITRIYIFPNFSATFKNFLTILGFSIFPGSIVPITCLVFFAIRLIEGQTNSRDEHFMMIICSLWALQILSVGMFALVRLRFRIGG